MKHSKFHIVPLALLAIGEQIHAQGEVVRLPGGPGRGVAMADLDGYGRREVLIDQTPTSAARSASRARSATSTSTAAAAC